MKTLITTITCLFFLVTGNAQGNRVFSGGEAVNFSIVDISAVGGIAWSTERTSLPGYFSLVNGATYTGCTDAANINGYIKKYGNSDFIFPVGSGNDLRTLGISSPVASTDAYATAWIAGNPDNDLDPTAPNAGKHPVLAVSAPIVAVSTAGQWDWQVGNNGNLGTGTTGTGAGLTITASIPDMTQFALAENLRLVGWNGENWIDLSGIATANGNVENSTVKGTMAEGITAIAIGTISKTLPFKLENFTAISANCNTVVSWKTSGETNIVRFVAEQSFDNSSFSAIGTMLASGLPGGAAYSVSASQPSGTAWYRLKIIYRDGTSAYSATISCHSNCSIREYMQVYPNPVSAYQNIYLSFATAYRGEARFIIFNSIGQRMMDKQVMVINGTNLVPTDVTQFAAGTYFISLVAEDGKQIGSVQKFIKQ